MILVPLALAEPAAGLASEPPGPGAVGLWDGWVLWAIVGIVLLLIVLAFEVVSRRAVVRFALPFFEREPPFNLVPEPATTGALVTEVALDEATNARGEPLKLSVAVIPAEGPPRGVVMFCPETGGSKWYWRRYAEALPSAGFAVVSFEHRGMFESDEDPRHVPGHWPAEPEVEDALAVVRAVLDDPGRFGLPPGLPLGAFGVSRGACVSLAAAAREPRIAAVAADGGFVTDSVVTEFARKWAMLAVPKWFVPLIPTWHLRQSMWMMRKSADRKKGIRHLALQRDLRALRDRPVWLVSGARDSYVTPEQARRLARAVDGTVWLVPKAKHNQSRDIAGAEYDRRLTAFFNSAFDRTA
ncbi:alpha/beta hydrolase [Alienimonas californiensis]|uniref:Alpha/beta hydrolase family protein n=1 Tax=Alienimonas californiensis TaxID=2527989 RepID=A0A517PCE5_9PLAN|nr:alpha/beta fold hydrolase [Alienimonas californiensis]QDT17040.1 Alpha/beta hydrolase family protein [Alienimonas californiensis]